MNKDEARAYWMDVADELRAENEALRAERDAAIRDKDSALADALIANSKRVSAELAVAAAIRDKETAIQNAAGWEKVARTHLEEVRAAIRERDEARTALQNLLDAEWMVTCDWADRRSREQVLDASRSVLASQPKEKTP